MQKSKSYAMFFLWCVLSAKVLAHDFWIQAEPFQPKSGEQVALSLYVGTAFDADTLPRIDEWIQRFESWDGQQLAPVAGDMGDDPAGTVRVDRPVAVIYQSERDLAVLTVEKFQAYLQEEGLSVPLGLKERWAPKVREWYSRFAKIILAPTAATGTVSNAGYRFGMPIELVPLKAPYALQADEKLPVQLLFRGKPLRNTRVTAYNQRFRDRPVYQRTDAQGQVVFDVSEAGIWLIKAVHIERAPENDQDVQWESFWATLTFER